MKSTISLISSLVLTGFASGFAISVTNISGGGSDPDLPILDNAGNPISNAFFAVGSFGSPTDVSSNVQDFVALFGAFQQFGTTLAVTDAGIAGLVNVITPAEFNLPIAFGSTDAPVGQDIYVVIGNDASLADSTEFAVWRSDSVFDTDDQAGQGGASVSLATGAGELIVGNAAGQNELTAGGNTITFADGIQLTDGAAAVIPEPSTSLLGALAGFALLARRRR